MVQSMMANTSKVKNTVWACSHGLTDQPMTATLLKTTFKVKDSIIGLMVVNTKETGSTTKWKATEFSLGPMEESTKDNTSTIKKKERENSIGLMVGTIMVDGKMVNSTE